MCLRPGFSPSQVQPSVIPFVDGYKKRSLRSLQEYVWNPGIPIIACRTFRIVKDMISMIPREFHPDVCCMYSYILSTHIVRVNQAKPAQTEPAR